MKKIIFLLIATVIAVNLFTQLSIQDDEQLSILNRQIPQQRLVVNKLQNKVLEGIKMKENYQRVQKQLASLDSLNQKDGLNDQEARQFKTLSIQIQKAKDRLLEFEFKNGDLDGLLEAEKAQLNSLINRKREIVDRATLNKETPKEVSVREKNLRDRGFAVKNSESDLNYKIRLQEETVKRLTSATVASDDNLGSYTICLVNYSKSAKRIFTVRGMEGTRSFEVAPDTSILISAIPQLYYCDITDLNNGNTTKNAYATVGLSIQKIDGKKCSAFFYALEYLRNGCVAPISQ